MTTIKMARIVVVGAILSALAGCEYYGPEKGASVVKESTSTSTEVQGSSNTVTDTMTDKINDLESKIEQEKNANTAESTSVIEGLQQEIDDLKNQLASAKDPVPTEAAKPTETPPSGKTPSETSSQLPTLAEVGPAVAVAVTDKYPTPSTPVGKPKNGTLADLSLKAGNPVVIDVNKGDTRKKMSLDKANQELRCSDLESSNPADASNRLVVIGFKVKSSHFGSYLGRQEDWDATSHQMGNHYRQMIPGTGTRNIRHLSLICGRIGKNGVVRSPYQKTTEVGSSLEGDGYDNGFLAFEDSEGAGEDGDKMDVSSWGVGENLPAQPNAIVTGIKLRVFQAVKSEARGESIANAEGGTYGIDSTGEVDMEGGKWVGKHTPTDGKVIQGMKFYGAKLNPLGDPAKADADDALIDSRAESSADSPWLPGVGKGDLTSDFSCPPNHAVTGVNVRSNWFYGIVWVDSIECKEIVPLYQQ